MLKIFGLNLSIVLLLSFTNAKACEILPLAVDLQKAANTAQKHNIPVVIFFTGKRFIDDIFSRL